MQKKQKDKLVKLSELAELADVRKSTLKFYAEIGILPHAEGGDGIIRLYKEKESLKRIKEIRNLRVHKRRAIDEIIEYYKKNK